ncbi:MAG: hypothetical protein KDE53_04855 [Caldilineaceae bacterium]|nr:hypothetical protein [Caldilineaceae bacterium]
MSFLRKLFGGVPRRDGMALATSTEKSEYAQIALLAEFVESRSSHAKLEQQLWTRALPQSYEESLALFQKLGWLTQHGDERQVTEQALPFVNQYRARLATEKAAVLPKVRAAIAARDTSEALTLRRAYEARQPLGKADWTGPEPQLSHSALTRRILFLEHWLLDGFSAEAVAWLKNYAAEEHLWGAYWRLRDDDIPPAVQQELATEQFAAAEAAYWKAYQLALYVDNQETWQRCKGGDHVRRLEIVGADDGETCEHCRQFLGKQYLVARVPELPHRACTAIYGCRCRYEPVLESYEE